MDTNENLGMNRRDFVKFAAGAAVVAGVATAFPTAAMAADPFPMPALPYADNALEPVISARTISFHYGKHTAAYYKAINTLYAEKKLSGTLEGVIAATHGKDDMAAVYNNAAQSWNHTFYWNCLKPGGGGEPKGKLADAIQAAFGSFPAFGEKLVADGLGQFGSGWVWLVQKDGKLSIMKTPNAVCPLATGFKPVFVLDVWEHAYYLDYQNLRKDYLMAALGKLANWDFAAKQLG
ncbi:MAG: superoxide dismutase [Humidesulfovibrio sp.]|jgi:Fe-Mn family superoxide dismutase